MPDCQAKFIDTMAPAAGTSAGCSESACGFRFSARGRALHEKLRHFMEEKVYPAEKVYAQQMQDLASQGNRWKHVPAVLEDLKEEAKACGLWNLFLPSSAALDNPDGLSNLDYAPLAEAMGAIAWSAEVFNCSAPDSGNMEILAKYGNEAQRKLWLVPLLAGHIRSAFCMSEPSVASSDATNMELRVSKLADGRGGYVLSGRKWWATGALDPRCELLMVMGRCADADARAPHERHSIVLVPRRAAGVRVVRALSVFGYDDAPHGHAEVAFDNVVVAPDALLLGEGRGFEIAQGRLGPGRIHHCMRAVGAAERCLALAARRACMREPFGSPLVTKDLVRAAVAECRLQIEQTRLLVLSTAAAMDRHGSKAARQLIAMCKVAAPRMGCHVADVAMQVFGGAGVSQDTPLAHAYASLRTLRIADGPDEVHLLQIGRLELSRLRRTRDADPLARVQSACDAFDPATYGSERRHSEDVSTDAHASEPRQAKREVRSKL